MTLYRQWLGWCFKRDIPAISIYTAARLMAVLYEYGNNEGFTNSQKFRADMEYIQERFGLIGSMTPDPEFSTLLREYVAELQEYQEVHKNDPYDDKRPYRQLAPDWAPELLKERYGIKFIN